MGAEAQWQCEGKGEGERGRDGKKEGVSMIVKDCFTRLRRVRNDSSGKSIL